MEFAYFTHVWGKPGMTPYDRYEQLWRELTLADGLGFDYGFCVEHHFRPEESWMSAPSLFAAAAARCTKNMRLGPMGYVVPLYSSLRLAEEIAVTDQMLGGRLELGLVPGINPGYFGPFGLHYEDRKAPTLEFLDYLEAAFGEQPFTYKGEHHHTENALMAVMPVQKPRPPIWMMSRDPETLDFCARYGLNTGFFLVFPRKQARERYEVYLEDWAKAGWDTKPRIGYSTVVYVDETDEKAMEVALQRASRAYQGFVKPGPDPFEERVKTYAETFVARGEPGAAEIVRGIFDKDYILDNTLMFIGSPETVADQLRAAAEEGLFNCFMGEFNFGDLPEEDLMRSVRLFGEKVAPALKDVEPF
ncbi:MAG: LLM class flavin-dependent oxidoreductase [Rhodospirillaceae bacterium]|jgi:alkanesulfonate monooxygenase SsuD/methylene tetrahydromethanopterin reductase-like flavin-dependent oxidoreductase (luciferase family)